MAKYYKCPFCDRRYLDKGALILHMEKLHNDELHGLTPSQVYFNYINRYELTKANGRSVISGKPTKWNEATGRYERFLPEEKAQYRQYFLNNMKKAGKENIMKDPEHQKEMLASRGISGKYKWSDGTEFVYTGSYERKFLEFLDKMLGFPSSDIMTPAPQIFSYRRPDGTEHFHIPDVYITSLNLIVSIKSADNKHYRLRDLEIEKAEDAAVEKSGINYIKIYDNQFGKFMDGVNLIKADNEDERQNTKRQVVIESANEPVEAISLTEEDELWNSLLD